MDKSLWSLWGCSSPCGAGLAAQHLDWTAAWDWTAALPSILTGDWTAAWDWTAALDWTAASAA